VLSRDDRLTAALTAAGQGERNRAASLAGALLRDDPFDADAHYIQGLVALAGGQPGQAVGALRRALYADTRFALAAFALGRAYDALADRAAASRSYRRALALGDPGDHRHDILLQQVDIGDIAAACRVRLGG
jgi:tetratricopeptide (TPR) repeat protein